MNLTANEKRFSCLLTDEDELMAKAHWLRRIKANVAQIDLVQDGLVEEVQLEFVVLAQHFLEQLGVRVQLFHAHDVLICSLELTLKVH